MSNTVLTTVNKINAATLTYAPAVLQGVIGVEAAVAPDVPGQTKQQLVVNAIDAGAKAAEGVPIPEVQGIATLVDLFVQILNSAGLFKHASTPQPAAAQPAQ